MGDVISFPTPARSWPEAVKAKRPNPTKRRSFSAERLRRTYLDVYADDVLLGMISIDRNRVLAWSADWSTILDQPDVATAVDAIRSGKVRNQS